MMKDLAVLSLELIFFILASLEKPWQSICSRIWLVLAIIDSKMVSKELLGSTDLSEAQTLCIHEIIEIIVVRKDKNLLVADFKVVAPSLKWFIDD